MTKMREDQCKVQHSVDGRLTGHPVPVRFVSETDQEVIAGRREGFLWCCAVKSGSNNY